MSSTPPAGQKLSPVRAALRAISQRTRTPLPSLILSFGIIHEVTAIFPLAGFFFTARAFGVGETVVRAITLPTPSDEPGEDGGIATQIRDGAVGQRLREWMAEGETHVEKVGRRHGWFGFEKGSTPSPQAVSNTEAATVSGKIAGDVANAVVAYALTKAIFPVRVGLSLYLAPGFSRTLVQPVGTFVARIFKRSS
ncbi:uncharacterized protein BXZ73DRAFT_49782 [Epithele typhae]|uniref:uncharacterized protein n=1 Tax=Epithele typhae TaxID=378194 RepID=UPI002007C54F|nr:uncharacterized protein BXZ73DRAFT_49782 [Epithele typhae]KAH9925941.1 hypothetical protein BXZ73DRAFT_49782 [Epithele typhae]